jgi:cytoskeletal protein CcmA (bactofilin family)
MEMGRSGWRRLEIGRGNSRVQGSVAEREPVSRADPLTTFIHAGCQAEGQLVLQNSIQLDGEFSGGIETSESVTVGEDAAIQAGIRARSVVIRGAVVGNIYASREVVLYPTARLHGDVETPSFVIERGAFFEGRTRMFRPEKVARPRPAPADSPDARTLGSFR